MSTVIQEIFQDIHGDVVLEMQLPGMEKFLLDAAKQIDKDPKGQIKKNGMVKQFLLKNRQRVTEKIRKGPYKKQIHALEPVIYRLYPQMKEDPNQATVLALICILKARLKNTSSKVELLNFDSKFKARLSSYGYEEDNDDNMPNENIFAKAFLSTCIVMTFVGIKTAIAAAEYSGQVDWAGTSINLLMYAVITFFIALLFYAIMG